jgi:hypothetical protein
LPLDGLGEAGALAHQLLGALAVAPQRRILGRMI